MLFSDKSRLSIDSQEVLSSVLGSRGKGQGPTIDRGANQYTHDLENGMIQPAWDIIG